MAKPFDVQRFKDFLHTSWVGREFVYIKQVDSTNTYLKKFPAGKLIHGTVVLTDHQKKGRGQYEKTWESAPCRNLTFTLGFRPQTGDRLSYLTLAVASAISDALQYYTNEFIAIKWPNDLLAGDRKIGGILTECIFNGSKPDRVIIGVGLNIHQKKFSTKLNNYAISLEEISAVDISREELLSDILHETEKVYQKWHKFDTALQREINRKLIGYGEWVKICIYNHLQPSKFKFIGVSDKGELLMLNEQLDVNKFSYEQIRIIPPGRRVSEKKTELPA